MNDTPLTGVLSREQIESLLERDPPLLEGLVDREMQLQPNGVDLTLDTVSGFTGPGTLTLDNANRRLPGTQQYPVDPDQQIYLSPGCYEVRFNETINLPDDCMAYTRPRSSLLRSGVALHTAVWDAGYTGRGVALLVVYNTHGFRMEHNARIAQMVFHAMGTAAGEGYQGVYSGEGKR
ncbi:MAG: deoxyuridine 5'-triphosphate nucleotidohydrolase [Thermomicrobiaceae bacterium]